MHTLCMPSAAELRHLSLLCAAATAVAETQWLQVCTREFTPSNMVGEVLIGSMQDGQGQLCMFCCGVLLMCDNLAIVRMCTMANAQWLHRTSVTSHTCALDFSFKQLCHTLQELIWCIGTLQSTSFSSFHSNIHLVFARELCKSASIPSK